MPFQLPRPVSLAQFLLIGLALHGYAASAQEIPTEHTVRAAMVFNFLKFTEFPPESLNGSRGNSPSLKLCMAVRDPRQAQALAALAGRKIGGRELQVIDFNPKSGKCHVFYVDSRQRWNAAAEQLALTGTLSISPVTGFAGNDDGMIEITAQKDAIGFEINLKQSRRVGFRFAPQLLRLARRIHE